jgi:hypothetical protein
MFCQSDYRQLRSQFNDLKIRYEKLVQKVSHGCTDATCTECDGIKAQILAEKDVHASGVVACDGCGSHLTCGDVFYDSNGGWGAACSIACIQESRKFVMVYRAEDQKIFDPPKTVVIDASSSENAEEIFEHSYDGDDLLWVIEGDNPHDAIESWLNGGEA